MTVNQIENVQQQTSAFRGEGGRRTHGETFRPLVVLKLATGTRFIHHVHDGRGLWDYGINEVKSLNVRNTQENTHQSRTVDLDIWTRTELIVKSCLHSFRALEKLNDTIGFSQITDVFDARGGRSSPEYSLLMFGRLAGQELLMGRPCWAMPWLPYMSMRLPGMGIWGDKAKTLNRDHRPPLSSSSCIDANQHQWERWWHRTA